MDISHFTRRMRRVFCITVSPLFLSASARMAAGKKAFRLQTEKTTSWSRHVFFRTHGKKARLFAHSAHTHAPAFAVPAGVFFRRICAFVSYVRRIFLRSRTRLCCKGACAGHARSARSCASCASYPHAAYGLFLRRRKMRVLFIRAYPGSSHRTQTAWEKHPPRSAFSCAPLCRAKKDSPLFAAQAKKKRRATHVV